MPHRVNKGKANAIPIWLSKSEFYRFPKTETPNKKRPLCADGGQINHLVFLVIAKSWLLGRGWGVNPFSPNYCFYSTEFI
jgi:hypothetical protein